MSVSSAKTKTPPAAKRPPPSPPSPPEPPFDSARFLATLGPHPGVYTFYQADGATLYIGKAANLKTRVSSYFGAAVKAPKTRLMVSKIHHAEAQRTRTESEALLLENNLIKSKRPRYNIALRDDKSFPYIRLSTGAQFPRFTFYRGRRGAPGKYFGPWPNAAAVREMLTQLHKIFRLRQCNDAFFRNRSRPCLQHQINRCSAPCVGLIAADEYQDDVRQAVAMLGGRDFALTEELASRMERAAAAQEYEAAARHRDRIALLQRARARQYVAAGSGDADVVAVALAPPLVCFGVVSVRRGQNLGGRYWVHKNPLELDAAELLAAFLPQHYLGAHAPPEILLSEPLRGEDSLRRALALDGKSRVKIKHRCRAHRARWIDAARTNTAEHLRAHLTARSQLDAQFDDLAALLSLPEPPARIECFDISHTQGERAVGACVVCDRGGAVKSDYRRFNLSGLTPGDDYAAMRETLTRRYRRVLQADGKLPDLLLIDGGKAHLAVAQEVLGELQPDAAVTLVAVSKGAARRAGEEQLHLTTRARAIIPGRASGALRLIQRVRDEAHRFAITAHRRRRATARKQSTLQRIDGIGEKRRRSLLRHFGGLREVVGADVEDLAAAPGISAALARRIYAELHE